jgi:hypothetical protein
MLDTTIPAIKILFKKLLEEKELGSNQLAYIDELLSELEN